MRLPGPQTDPAEVGLAALVLANHVVAAAVLQGVKFREQQSRLHLLNGSSALGALLRVGRDPVTRFAAQIV